VGRRSEEGLIENTQPSGRFAVLSLRRATVSSVILKQIIYTDNSADGWHEQ